MRRTVTVVFLFVLVSALAAFADDWNRTYTVQGRPQLVVDADDGNVTISPAAGNQVRLNVHTEGYRISPDDIEVTAQQQGNRVELRLRKHHSGLGFHFHTSLEIRVTLPGGSDLDVHTGDGNLEVSGINGKQSLRTGDGNAEIRGTTGALELETGDGNLDVDGTFEVLALRTGDGNINAVARTGSAMKSAWTIRTGDGNIHLRVPQNFAADVDAHTGDGSVRTDFPITTNASGDDRQDLRGKMNGGGQVLMLRSGDGSIELRR